MNSCHPQRARWRRLSWNLRSGVAAAFLAASAASPADVVPDPPKQCAQCAEWNQPQAPFRVFGNTYYVGTTELSSIAIETTDGLILLDGALPQSAPLIEANLHSLGFATKDIRLILTSHTHFDHVGGIAALQRASGARVAASPKSATALMEGRPTPDDPQFDIADNGFPAVANVRVIADGETLTLGGVRVTAHFTPGHTPGSTTWTWRSCEGSRCVNVVYADSLNAVSADSFHFGGTDESARARVASFKRSIETVRELPCDVLLAPHPRFAGMEAKHAKLLAGDADAFVDTAACRRYAEAADRGLARRLAAEGAATSPASSPSL